MPKLWGIFAQLLFYCNLAILTYSNKLHLYLVLFFSLYQWFIFNLPLKWYMLVKTKKFVLMNCHCFLQWQKGRSVKVIQEWRFVSYYFIWCLGIPFNFWSIWWTTVLACYILLLLWSHLFCPCTAFVNNFSFIEDQAENMHTLTIRFSISETSLLFLDSYWDSS